MQRLLLILLMLAASAAAWAGDLVPALRQSNTLALERLGASMGASGLAEPIRGAHRPLALAAIRASVGAEDRWALLDDLQAAAAGPDRSIAIAAAEMAAELSHALDDQVLDAQEVALGNLLALHDTWLDLAQDQQRWVDIRVYAFDTASALYQLLPSSSRPGFELAGLLSDGDPEMRAAVLVLAPESIDLDASADKALASESSENVALAGGQRLCGPLGMARSRALPALSEGARTRLLKLSTDKSLEIAARADLAPCLLSEGSKESLRALALLQQRSPPALRRSLLNLSQSR